MAFTDYSIMQGKTDVAMLTILRILDQHRKESSTLPIAHTINKDDFKIIYVLVLSTQQHSLVLQARLMNDYLPVHP